MIRKGEYYQHPQVTWDKETCEKIAKRTVKDGYGTPYPFKGYIHPPTQLGWHVRYNGGCVRNGDWWEGEIFPLPKVSKGFEIEHVSSWGYRLVKKNNRTA
jgi:hypothetical protein